MLLAPAASRLLDGLLRQYRAADRREDQRLPGPDETGGFTIGSQSDRRAIDGHFENVPRFDGQFIAKAFRKDDPARLVDGNEHVFHTIATYHYHFEMAILASTRQRSDSEKEGNPF